jgi:hypothetical protein
MTRQRKAARPALGSGMTVEVLVSGLWSMNVNRLAGMIRAKPGSKYMREAGTPVNGQLIGTVNRFLHCIRQTPAEDGGSRLPASVQRLSARTLGSLTALERSALIRAAHQSGKGKVAPAAPAPTGPAKEDRIAELRKISADAWAEIGRLRPPKTHEELAEDKEYDRQYLIARLLVVTRKVEVLLLLARSSTQTELEALFCKEFGVSTDIAGHMANTGMNHMLVSPDAVAKIQADLDELNAPDAPPAPEVAE